MDLFSEETIKQNFWNPELVTIDFDKPSLNPATIIRLIFSSKLHKVVPLTKQEIDDNWEKLRNIYYAVKMLYEGEDEENGQLARENYRSDITKLFWACYHWNKYIDFILLKEKSVGSVIELTDENDQVISVKIKKFLSIDDDQNVYLVEIDDKEMVLKIGLFIYEEINTYKKMMSHKVLLPPGIRTDLYLLYNNILIMPYLQPLNENFVKNNQINPYQIGIDLFSVIESYEDIAVHSDIKPDNIYYYEGKFYLLDFGNCSVERKAYGFVREAFSTYWTSQTPWEGLITTIKYDLIELAFVMNWFVIVNTLKRKLNYENGFRFMTTKVLKNYFDFLSQQIETVSLKEIKSKLLEILSQEDSKNILSMLPYTSY